MFPVLYSLKILSMESIRTHLLRKKRGSGFPAVLISFVLVAHWKIFGPFEIHLYVYVPLRTLNYSVFFDNCQATGTGTGTGTGTWDLGPGTWDLGPGTWDPGPRT